jgi:hypothetical protein
MKRLKQFLFLYFLSFCLSLIGEGFCAGTLIQTTRGPVPIESITVGDTVVSCSPKGADVSTLLPTFLRTLPSTLSN